MPGNRLAARKYSGIVEVRNPHDIATAATLFEKMSHGIIEIVASMDWIGITEYFLEFGEVWDQRCFANRPFSPPDQ